MFLVDPVTGRQANSSAAVRARLGELDGRVERELDACQIELITNVCTSAGEAEITGKDRYEPIHDLLGDAVATPISGMHIHIVMPDAETAIRAFNGLRGYRPLSRRSRRTRRFVVVGTPGSSRPGR